MVIRFCVLVLPFNFEKGTRTVVLLSGKLIGVHEYIIRKQEKMWKRDINRYYYVYLVQNIPPFNSGKHRIVIWERSVWDNVKDVTKLNQ